MDEEAGSKHSEVLCEAVGRVRAAGTQRTQTITAPDELFNIEEPAQHAEHTHRHRHVHIANAAVHLHKQLFRRAIQAGQLDNNNQYNHQNNNTIFILVTLI